MSPLPSIAPLLIQRNPASGAYVPCWKTVGVAFGLRSSYQRIPVELPAVTLCVTTSDSWSPKLRYANRYISRSASESSCWVVPLCGMHVPPAQAGENDATGIIVGPVRAEFAGVAQSTWNFQSSRLLVPKLAMKFGDPAGGAFGPSRSDGRRPPNVVLRVKHCCVAAAPVSIFARS